MYTEKDVTGGKSHGCGENSVWHIIIYFNILHPLRCFLMWAISGFLTEDVLKPLNNCVKLSDILKDYFAGLDIRKKKLNLTVRIVCVISHLLIF